MSNENANGVIYADPQPGGNVRVVYKDAIPYPHQLRHVKVGEYAVWNNFVHGPVLIARVRGYDGRAFARVDKLEQVWVYPECVIAEGGLPCRILQPGDIIEITVPEVE